jgi:hypothetical protein
MKSKSMKTLSYLIFVLALSPLFVRGQATIAFANQGTSQLIYIDGSGLGLGTTPIGPNSNSIALGAGPGQVVFQLWMATNGAPVNLGPPVETFAPVGMVLVGTVTNSTSTNPLAQGIFNGGNPYTLPAPFDGSFQVEFVYYAHTLNGLFSGRSALATGYTPAISPSPITPTFGTGANQVLGFTLGVPEPSTFALGGLGAAMLLLRWRKKQYARSKLIQQE